MLEKVAMKYFGRGIERRERWGDGKQINVRRCRLEVLRDIMTGDQSSLTTISHSLWLSNYC